MPRAEGADGEAGAARRAVRAWCLYDFANSAFTTVVVTFVYAAFFTKRLAASENEGFALWTWGISATGLVVALTSPVLGAIADRSGRRKRFLLVSTVICVTATALLYVFGPGQALLALVVFTVANVAYEMGCVFYNAFLPGLAPPARIGRISGYGWALGYAGGLLAMVVALLVFVLPDPPLLGLDATTDQPVRATCLLVAAWFALFSVPLFLHVPEDRRPPPAAGRGTVGSAFRQLARTFREVRRYRQVARLLLARLVYNDGLVTIFALGGIYAASRFDFSTTRLILFGLLLNLSAGLGALAFGFLDDRLGGRTTILVSIAALIVTSAAALLARTEAVFWVATTLMGVFLGPNQAASRSLLGRFVPPSMENEFFGFFAFSGKATSFLGPLVAGRVTGLLDAEGVPHAQSWGLGTLVLFLVVGGIVLLTVDEAEGVRAAGRGTS